MALKDVLASSVRPGTLVEPLDERRIRCVACGHACPLPDGAAGVCKVRFNRGGTLYVPWGYVGGVQCDPVEKKPFFHVLPGSLAFSFGMLGCDLHCGYCQNWVTSQALRDPSAVVPPRCDRSGDAGPRRRARWRAAAGLHLQRAAHHRRVGGRDLHARPPRRPADGVCLQRQRHAAGARLPAAAHRLLQGRPEVVRRRALPPARGTARADSRDDCRPARARDLGGGGDAAGAGLQRLGRRDHGADASFSPASRRTSRGTSPRFMPTTR